MADAFVFSVNRDTVAVDCGQLGVYDIKGAGNKIWARTLITDRKVLKDFGEKFEPYTETGYNIAKDIVDRSPVDGFFLFDGKEPDKATLDEAMAKHKAACVQLVRHADSIWERTRNREIISERDRRAARFLGAAPEWLDQSLVEDKKKCPRCAELIKAEASFCRFCQYDLAGKPAVPASR